MPGETKYSGYINTINRELVNPKLNAKNFYERNFYNEISDSPIRKINIFNSGSRWQSSYFKDFDVKSPISKSQFQKPTNRVLQKNENVSKEKFEFSSQYTTENHNLQKLLDNLTKNSKLNLSPPISSLYNNIDSKRSDRHFYSNSEYSDVYGMEPKLKYDKYLEPSKYNKKVFLDNLEISKGTPRASNYIPHFSGYIPHQYQSKLKYNNDSYLKSNKINYLENLKTCVPGYTGRNTCNIN